MLRGYYRIIRIKSKDGGKEERKGGRERVRKERDSRRKKRREGVEWMNSDLKFTSSSRNEVSSNSLSRFS